MRGILSIILLDADPELNEISHQSFIGNLICDDGQVGRCIGHKINPPNVHECCNKSEFWELTIEFGGKIQIWGPLLRTGGDVLCLSLNVQDTLIDSIMEDQNLESFEFKTTRLKIDDNAKDFVSKYYPNVSFKPDMIVCQGPVSWQYQI